MQDQHTAPAITVVLSADQPWAYAQFLKRVGLDSDYRQLAVDQEEAYTMRRPARSSARSCAAPATRRVEQPARRCAPCPTAGG